MPRWFEKRSDEELSAKVHEAAARAVHMLLQSARQLKRSVGGTRGPGENLGVRDRVPDAELRSRAPGLNRIDEGAASRCRQRPRMRERKRRFKSGGRARGLWQALSVG